MLYLLHVLILRASQDEIGHDEPGAGDRRTGGRLQGGRAPASRSTPERSGVGVPYGEERWSSGTLPTDYRFTGQRLEAPWAACTTWGHGSTILILTSSSVLTALYHSLQIRQVLTDMPIAWATRSSIVIPADTWLRGKTIQAIWN